MADELTQSANKWHSLIVSIVTAAISAFTAVTIAKLHESTEATKARLGYEAIAQHINDQDKVIKQNAEETIKLKSAVETMNGILQYAFMSQAGVKSRTYADAPTYVEHTGAGRPPARPPIVHKQKISPPKLAATETVEKLQTLSNVTKADTKVVVVPKVEPLPVKLDDIAKKTGN